MRVPVTRALLLVLGLVLLVAPAHARKRRHPPRLEWGLGVSASAIYNDNLLAFSEADQNAFRRADGAYPIPLETVDDLENELQIHPGFRWRAPLATMVSGDYRLKLVNRTQNSFTNYQTHTISVGIRPRVSGYRWSARVRAFAIPSMYLRAYKDRDYNEYHSARFRNWEYEGAFRYRFWQPLWLEARAAWGSYYYNRKFTEYDSEYHDVSLAASYATPWRFDLSGGYTRRWSDNVGKDQSGALSAILPPDVTSDAEYGDGDFNEDEVNAALAIQLPLAKAIPLKGSLGYRLRRRVYTTNRPLDLDPFHRGRLDRRGVITTSLKTELTRALAAETYFAYEARHTDSPTPSAVLAKNFIRREFGLMLSYQIR